ncbi:RNA methyltransferase [Flammeovirga yaeyamensis]|uniref:RNA methyltransferase n=1 Tax=Flammeovirga yaeyamensis TaxID=367791 RepID=A0AAX1N2U7_9BACT|nr:MULTISPECIES: RNA methyltransferase [Flammeovirga]ANQ50734.1 RNA methyltransferase [Flammeovirga sp. MY04]MBB3701071.1 tRNA G18 (ribose-2'-O)-methylase SpoU [Flammeovirga yaeyamensis]NMF38098.1 RNA methyltransferase [Flammeovirga yaeyamensis]QWG01870.1 RNA methyltransferase [Flammeovirga yaeyamensis]
MRKLSMDELNRVSAEEFKSQEKNNIVVVLDNIRSLNNVGSSFRTGDAFAIEKVVLCGITGKPPHRDIHKTALGAQDTVAWEHFDETVDAIKKLKEEGYKVYAVEQVEGSTMLQDLETTKDEKIALVFGNEVMGVSDEAIEEVDAALEIPQFGTKHSLNVSVTIGVVLWQVLQKKM